MRLVLTTPMYNEVNHIDTYMENVFDLDIYDDIVVLDDGSDDGTYDKLKFYESNYDNIHVFRNEQNSIESRGINRWYTLSQFTRDLNPDWVNVRAADTFYSYKCKDLLKHRLEHYTELGMHVVAMPWVNVWRSKTWARMDGMWGNWVLGDGIRTFWRFNKNFSWHEEHTKTGMHQGFVIPTYLNLSEPFKTRNMNLERPWEMVNLHLGMCDHDCMVEKFRSTMKNASDAAKMGRSFGMPPPSNMPPVREWGRFNGYMAFYEFGMKLERVPQSWKEDVDEINESYPKIESLYEVIKEFNKPRAEEYKTLFERTYGSN